MIDSLKGQLYDWQYGRNIIKGFINELSEADLDKPFPRKNLNSLRKQCVELIQIQSCYVNALNTRKMQFEYDSISDTSKLSLLSRMDALDTHLVEYLETFDGSETIDWFGEQWNIHRHISAMIGHEQMHIGQIVAFCYAVGIQIPEEIKRTMALSD